MTRNILELSGRPIRSLQTYLRTISFHYDIPRVIPDGIYGDSTERAVSAFQETFGLEVTGKTDLATWEAIVGVYSRVIAESEPPQPLPVFPAEKGFKVKGGDSLPLMRAVQHMLNAAAKRFANLPAIAVSGVNDPDTQSAVRIVQRLSGLPETGEIDCATWNAVSTLRSFCQD